MLDEIGGEFWEADLSDPQPIHENACEFLLAGRTALDYIIKDIKKGKGFRKVYMPSYCCHSMIQPFHENGIGVEFYDVGFENGRYVYSIDFSTKCDVVFIMQYFGFCSEKVEPIIKRLQDDGKTIIEDATHSWLLDIPYGSHSDYVFASFRKWTGVAGGAVAIKHNGGFRSPPPLKTNRKYIELRAQAATLKKQYIQYNAGEKADFLSLYDQAEELLERDYQDYSLPQGYEDVILRLDFGSIKLRRQANARCLLEGLKHCKGVKCVVSSGKDVPLFVPIMVKYGKRDELRRYLIDNRVYCPVHWPLSPLHKISDKYIYENSLSLVCDQRYGQAEMERFVTLINVFCGG